MIVAKSDHGWFFQISVKALGLMAGLAVLVPATARADGIHTCGNNAPIGSFCYYETKPETYIPGLLGSHGVSTPGRCLNDSRGNDKYCSNTLTNAPRRIGICPVALSRSNRYCEINR